jgi:succinyl-CoA synthetase beta subunit
MKLHEYQSKQIFSSEHIPIPQGKLASTPIETRQIAEELGYPVVLKAQVLSGGRGKAGGIRLVRSSDEVEDEAARILSSKVKDFPVRSLLVDKAVSFKQEIYLGITLDRSTGKPVIIASGDGGIDIEEVARTAPERIIKASFDPLIGLRDYIIRDVATEIDLEREYWREFHLIAQGLWNVYIKNDATLAEINPLVITTEGHLIALDGKITIDDNALTRQREFMDLRDLSAETSDELEARKFGLSFIRLSGNIGCLVNGAGLAMATMDNIKIFGGNPANFLDIGGGANAEKVGAALKIILKDPNIKSILINIFGGITRCDEVSKGILVILSESEIKIPMIVRLVGTNAEEGKRLLMNANQITADSLYEAARLAVQAANEGNV